MLYANIHNRTCIKAQDGLAHTPALSIVREGALATAGCDVASYGFAVPASVVITGTNAASMHAIPKAMIIIFDMTRTLKPNKETIGPEC
jgi:hypothetical protein